MKILDSYCQLQHQAIEQKWQIGFTSHANSHWSKPTSRKALIRSILLLSRTSTENYSVHGMTEVAWVPWRCLSYNKLNDQPHELLISPQAVKRFDKINLPWSKSCLWTHLNICIRDGSSHVSSLWVPRPRALSMVFQFHVELAVDWELGPGI